MMKKHGKQFVVCIKSDPNADLEVRKIYQVLPDEKAAEDNYIRVVDESGEDYLYPAAYFFPVEVPQAAVEALMRAA